MYEHVTAEDLKDVITALLNAASAIGLALTTDVLVTELKETKGELGEPVAGAVV